MGNEVLMASLVSWARDDARIYPPVFDCRYYGECNASAGGALPAGDTCMMSYVGRRYGSSVPGEEFRLVLVGIDHGEKVGGTFEDRRNQVEDHHQNGCASYFRSHYKGVVRTAAAIFGRTGDYCRQQCTKVCQKSHDPEAAPHCVIDRIVQPNLVKCVRGDIKGAGTKSTGTMMANCAHHLASELKRLRPGLVVFHGTSSKESTVRAFVACALDMEAVEGVLADQHGPSVLYKSEVLGAYVLFLHHPSYGWLGKQWKPVVEPALSYLRSRGLIPAKGPAPSGDGSTAGGGGDHRLFSAETTETMAVGSGNPRKPQER